ncbi:MAG: Flagellar assembly protein FliH [Brockia lithotrophica]|uniref:Flagellar assembly protein FliH n=1 Tax=Brockia lithotrophica TaxID=933949 RepID=A0A2T5G924_9BACL|nr:MAG: Flagellar assembly protein FliH [Brockia lithotrophica]
MSEATGLFKGPGVERAAPLRLALPAVLREAPADREPPSPEAVGGARLESLLRKRALLERERLLREAREALAREEAERRRAWEEEARRLRDEARREGYAAGYAEGNAAARREAEAALAERLAALEEAQEALLAERDAMRKALLREAEEAVFLLAETVVREALRDEERLVRYVRSQLRERLEGGHAVLFAAPEDFPVLRRLLAEEEASSDAVSRSRFELRIDPRLARGDFRLEVARGVYEGSVRAQVDRLLEAWKRYQEVGGEPVQEG